jgi:hypothetical protein
MGCSNDGNGVVAFKDKNAKKTYFWNENTDMNL